MKNLLRLNHHLIPYQKMKKNHKNKKIKLILGQNRNEFIKLYLMNKNPEKKQKKIYLKEKRQKKKEKKKNQKNK